MRLHEGYSGTAFRPRGGCIFELDDKIVIHCKRTSLKVHSASSESLYVGATRNK